ncbi:MAG: hypothetical protein UX66_C0020G0006 [Parcubacteria group bacterium GW2011_GWF2_46_8]|nr:MAG: hypothetical protein UX66_C0020G0006 [Parcubacteria group bacterium GW2011_GWF2_46_8]
MDWAQFEKGVFLVNVLGIVYDSRTRLILIGRRENGSFPGGRPAYQEDLDFYLKEQVKTKTDLEVEVKNIVFAKTYPEKREFLSIYYLCEFIGGEAKAGEKFVEIKWVKPTEVQSYFTTSLHRTLLEYLKTLE